jgi:hypothetical protein
VQQSEGEGVSSCLWMLLYTSVPQWSRCCIAVQAGSELELDKMGLLMAEVGLRQVHR